MPRRKSAAYMSAGEQIAGTVLFVLYLLVLPFVTAPLFRLIGGLLRLGLLLERPAIVGRRLIELVLHGVERGQDRLGICLLGR